MADEVATTTLRIDAGPAKAGADQFQVAADKIIKANEQVGLSFETATKRVATSTSSQTKMLEAISRSVDPFGAAITKATRQLAQLQDVIAKGGPNAARAAELMGAAQQRLVTVQKAAATATDVHSASLTAHAKSSNAAAFAARDLGVQMIDVGQAIATGQPLLRTLIQQGSQVGQVMASSGVGVREMAASIRGSLGSALGFVVSPMGLVAAGTTLAIGGIAALSIAAETSSRRIESLKNALSAVRPDFAAAAADADAVARKLAQTTNLNITEGRAGAKALYGSGTFFGSPEDAAFVIKQFSDISKLLGETEVNFQRLSDAARDPAKYILDMAQKSSAFNSVMADEVKRLVEAGKMTEAWTIVLNANAKATKDVTDNMTALETASKRLHNAIAGTTESGETFAITLGTNINEKLALVVTGFAKLVELLNSIPKDWAGTVGNGLINMVPVLGTLNSLLEDAVRLRGMLPSGGATSGGTSGPEALWEMQRRGMVPFDLPTATGAGTSAPSATAAAAGMVTIRAPSGSTFTVAASAAPAFQGLINDLEGRGYRIDTTSSYRPGATVAGTGAPSMHATGLAIDINAARNAVGTRGDIPPELARELAAKYGMRWGGDFRNPDPMHFGFDSLPPPGATSPGAASAAATFARDTDATLQRLEQLRKQFDPTSASLRDLRTQYDALNEIVINNGQIVKNGTVVFQASDEQLKEYKVALANVAGAMVTTRTPQQEMLHGMEQQAALTGIVTEGDRRFAGVVQQLTEINKKYGGSIVDVGQATAILTKEQQGQLAQTEFALARQVTTNNELVTAYGISGEAVLKATASMNAWNEASRLFPLGAPEWHAAYQQLIRDNMAVAVSINEVEIARSNAATEENIKLIQRETEAVGMNADARNVMLAGLRAENDLKTKGIPLTSDLGQAYIKNAQDATAASQRLAQSRSAYDELANAASQSFQTISDAIAQTFIQGQGAAVNWANVMKTVVQQVVSEFLKLSVLNPLLNAMFPGSAHRNEIGDVFNALRGATGFGGAASAGAPIAIDAASAATFAAQDASLAIFMDVASTFHRGGLVGFDAMPGRYIHPSYFDNAPRFHNGLGGTEFAAILQKGERVLTERQQGQVRAASQGGGGDTHFHFSLPGITDQKTADSFLRSAPHVMRQAFDAQMRAKARNG